MKCRREVCKPWSYLIWSINSVQCWWHFLRGATQWTGNLRDMGGRLIRWWWGERRDIDSDWFMIWISASADVQSRRFLLGQPCSFNSSLSPCVHVCLCLCVCVWAAQLVGDREGRNVHGRFTAEPPRTVSETRTPGSPAETISAMQTVCESHLFSHTMTLGLLH